MLMKRGDGGSLRIRCFLGGEGKGGGDVALIGSFTMRPDVTPSEIVTGLHENFA